MRALSSLLLIATLLPAPAWAQPQPGGEPGVSPENPDATREARQHFERGLSFFEGHQYREAIQEFSLAAQLVPSADLWFNIARAHEELNELEQAIEFYQRYLRDRVDPPDRERVEEKIQQLRERAEAERAAAQSRPTTGTLRITADRDASAIAVDSRAVGTSPVDVPLSLPPGRHRLDVDHEGYVPFRSEVRLEAGVTTAAYADLVPETRYRAIRGKPIFTWIVGGLAAGALIGSMVTGITAVKMNNDGTSTRAEVRDRAAISDYLLGAGLGLAVTAVVLFFIERRSVGTETITVHEEPPATPHASRSRSLAAERGAVAW